MNRTTKENNFVSQDKRIDENQNINFNDACPSETENLPTEDGNNRNIEKSSSLAILLGILSLVGCLLPIIGFPVSIVGLFVSKQRGSNIGTYLCILGLILSIANAVYGCQKGREYQVEEIRRRTYEYLREQGY